MSNVWSLESMEEELDREYAPLVFTAGDETFTLISLSRSDKKVRDAVQERLKLINPETPEGEDDPDVDEDVLLEAVQFVLSSVTKDRKGAKLLRVLGDDVLKHMKLLQKWSEATQPGEASDSQD